MTDAPSKTFDSLFAELTAKLAAREPGSSTDLRRIRLQLRARSWTRLI